MTSRKKTEFHQIAEAKGWLLEQIAERWDISVRQMSRVANNATRKDLDAVNGLPKFDKSKKQRD